MYDLVLYVQSINLGNLLFIFAKHANYQLDLIQTHVISLHFGIKYCPNRSVIGPGGGGGIH